MIKEKKNVKEHPETKKTNQEANIESANHEEQAEQSNNCNTQECKPTPKCNCTNNSCESSDNTNELSACYEAKLSDLTNTLQRLQAEFENYRKRTDTECADNKKHAEANLIKTLLPILDGFEIALSNKQNNEEFHKGMELIYSQFHQLLEDHGLAPISAKGEKFNPREHEALLAEHQPDKEEHTILEELQKGYKLNGKVLRHTKVKISKK